MVQLDKQAQLVLRDYKVQLGRQEQQAQPEHQELPVEQVLRV